MIKCLTIIQIKFTLGAVVLCSSEPSKACEKLNYETAYSLLVDQIEIWKCWFVEEGGNLENPEKNLS